MTDKIDVEQYNEIFKLLEIRTNFLAQIAAQLGISKAIISNEEILDNIGQLQQAHKRIEEIINKSCIGCKKLNCRNCILLSARCVLENFKI